MVNRAWVCIYCFVTKHQKNNQALLKCIPCINFINDDNHIIEQWFAKF